MVMYTRHCSKRYLEGDSSSDLDSGLLDMHCLFVLSYFTTGDDLNKEHVRKKLKIG